MNPIIKPRVAIGIFVFILVIILTFVVAVPVQTALGIWGLAITELMLLACALVPALLLKWDLKEVFPLKIPSLRQLFGVLVLLTGSYLSVLTINMIVLYLFPQGLTDVSNVFLELFKSVPLPVALFIVAVMPAVCEECLHRGFILFNFQGVGKWATVLAMGLIFGIFHLDPYRFFGTAVLGLLLTFIMVETRNLLLPMLFHLLNNAFSVLASLTSEPSAEVIRVPLTAVGVYLVVAAIIPFIFLWGSRLLKSKEECRNNPLRKRAKLVAIIAALILFVSGIAIAAAGISQPPVFETAFSQSVNKDTQPKVLVFSVEKDSSFLIDLKIQGSGVITNVVISNARGEEVYTANAGAMTANGYIDLEAGQYTVIISYQTDSAEYNPVSVNLLIK